MAQLNVSIVAHTQHRVRSLSCCKSFSLSVSPAQQAFCVDVFVEVLSCQAGSTGSEARPGTNHAKTQATTGQPSTMVYSTLLRSQRRSTLGCSLGVHGILWESHFISMPYTFPSPVSHNVGIGRGPLFYPYTKVGIDAVTGRDSGAWWVPLNLFLHLFAYFQSFI